MRSDPRTSSSLASARPGPLTGATVAVTRATDQAGPLVERLVELGAIVVEIPIIAIVGPIDGGVALAAAVDCLHTYDWVVLASPNAARRFLTASAGVSLPRLAAVGPGTARVLTDAGAVVDLVPDRSIGEGLVDAFPIGPGRVLVPRAAVARDVIPVGLRAKGWAVELVEAYRTVPVDASTDDLAMLATADIVLFTSSSTVDALVTAAGVEQLPAVVVSMGEATTATALGHGVHVDGTADPSTLDGLLDAVIQAWSIAALRKRSRGAGPTSLPSEP